MSKTVLITGASTGFGRDTAEALAQAGDTVVRRRGVHWTASRQLISQSGAIFRFLAGNRMQCRPRDVLLRML
jgi:NAD(P)-dependent dehydrogenase (short-subunit alcohol dehydrogenase family)